MKKLAAQQAGELGEALALAKLISLGHTALCKLYSRSMHRVVQ